MSIDDWTPAVSVPFGQRVQAALLAELYVLAAHAATEPPSWQGWLDTGGLLCGARSRRGFTHRCTGRQGRSKFPPRTLKCGAKRDWAGGSQVSHP